MNPQQSESPSWDEPGCYQVAPDVYRIPLPLPHDGLRAVNVYAIIDGDRLVLVDSGQQLEIARSALQKALRSLSASLGDISLFLVTHIHRDHYTQAVALRREFGQRIYLGVGERESIAHAAHPTGNPLHDQLVELERCGASALVASITPSSGTEDIAGSLYEEPDGWLEEETIELQTRQLQVIATPGHTRGHVIFYDHSNRLLFAGDHILPHITPSIGFEPLVYPDPLGNYLRSLRRVRFLPDAPLLPAHGMPASGFHDRIDELLAHHDTRLEATQSAVKEGASNPYEVATALRWTRRGRHLSELDTFNQMLAVMETKYHLELLALQGELYQTLTAGTYRFHTSAKAPQSD
ncbi:MBL fold metallo-hydrolase [Ferrimicrobium sp.]|uniref:MBL fold metallo-hydrolase n=1 Tax=Ferrimicrobium sp. TaxID=2926050 RepID=UPI002614EB72|nr:MBL fold metallo-hydrolase [Ferrimicrobium sp.]